MFHKILIFIFNWLQFVTVSFFMKNKYRKPKLCFGFLYHSQSKQFML